MSVDDELRSYARSLEDGSHEPSEGTVSVSAGDRLLVSSQEGVDELGAAGSSIRLREHKGRDSDVLAEPLPGREALVGAGRGYAPRHAPLPRPCWPLWLAERALAFEQDRTFDVIRLDCFPAKLQGVTGADLLQADLAELDAARLDGIKQTVPVKRTFSLLADFPLQFAHLKQTGWCTFLTREEPFRFAYPGTYGYRIRAVTMTPRSYSGIAWPRGLLTNLGLSVVSRSDGSTHALLRPQDALPLSEFRLTDDMAVYGLPDEALLAFEGSGVEALWELTLPTLANRLSLDDLADIELTFDVRAHYSPQLRTMHLQSMPTSVRRLVFFSARTFAPADLEALRDPSQQSVTVEFDVPAIGRLPRLESNRTLRNIVLMLPGDKPFDFDASFAPQGSLAVQVPFVGGLAYSNAEPLTESGSQTPPSPLNVLVGRNIDTTFQLTIAKNGNATAFAEVEDVLLGLEYSAHIA